MIAHKHLSNDRVAIYCDKCGHISDVIDLPEFAAMIETGWGEVNWCFDCASANGQDLDDNFFYAKPGDIVTFREDIVQAVYDDVHTYNGQTWQWVNTISYVSIEVIDELPF